MRAWKLILINLLVAAITGAAAAQPAPDARDHEYAVKFVCGPRKAAQEQDWGAVAPGRYRTAINILYAGTKTAKVGTWIATVSEQVQAGTVIDGPRVELRGPEAVEIDCQDILRAAKADGFLKGFLLIRSSGRLNVTAVYTAAIATGVTSIDVETVAETVAGERMGALPCVTFDPPLVAGTRYGAAAGTPQGAVVFTTSGVPVSVHSFTWTNLGTTYNEAYIDATAPNGFGQGQSLRTNNINVHFDFAGIGGVSEVTLDFMDLGGNENLMINNQPAHVGELTAAPATIGGVTVTVTSSAIAGGKKGSLRLSGPIQQVRIGGQEFWIDNVCFK